MSQHGGGQREDSILLVTSAARATYRFLLGCMGFSRPCPYSYMGFSRPCPYSDVVSTFECLFTLGQPNKEYDGFVLYSKFLILEPRLVTFQPLDIDLMLTHDPPSL
jgi:hypothetical protein